MITVDYLLYDNRSWSPSIGRDWGVKVATGALAGDTNLRTSFIRYCTSLASDHGTLRGFGEAIGGIRSGSGGGYLLCVTLETPDPFRRPSWATYGLWCPDVSTLENVLLGDPIAAAKGALRADSPPHAIVVRRTATAFLSRSERSGADTPGLQRFDKGSTVAEVSSTVLHAIRERVIAPNILGITASSRLHALAQNFDRVYCHPLDERAERNFERLRALSAQRGAKASSPARPTSLIRVTLWAVVCLFGLIVTAGALFRLRPQAGAASLPATPIRISADSALRTLCAQIVTINDLDPLTLTRAHDQSAVAEMHDAVTSLIRDRERIVQIAGIACYCDEQTPVSAEAKLEKLAAVLGEDAVSAATNCKNVPDAQDAVLRQEITHWCTAFAALAAPVLETDIRPAPSTSERTNP